MKKYETIKTIMIMTVPKRTSLDFISNNILLQCLTNLRSSKPLLTSNTTDY